MNKSLALENVIYVPKPRSEFDISHYYHITLLKMALNKAANGRVIPKIKETIEMSPGRASYEISKSGIIDVYWLGTNKKIEQRLRAIKIPTTRGLIGYRKFLIHKDSILAFDKVKTINDLQAFTACQGAHWPDTDILKSANLEVTTATVYENIFKMLNAKRCDYFPRGYHDSIIELKLREKVYENLINYENILLYYPFAVYFFTNTSNKELGEWIAQGMDKLALNEDIERLMKSHSLTKSVFPLKNEKHSIFLDIPNPFLSLDTDVNNKIYWILPEEFNISPVDNILN